LDDTGKLYIKIDLSSLGHHIVDVLSTAIRQLPEVSLVESTFREFGEKHLQNLLQEEKQFDAFANALINSFIAQLGSHLTHDLEQREAWEWLIKYLNTTLKNALLKNSYNAQRRRSSLAVPRNMNDVNNLLAQLDAVLQKYPQLELLEKKLGLENLFLLLEFFCLLL